MSRIQITLSLNKITRTVFARQYGDILYVYGIDLVTKHGNKTHSGFLVLQSGRDDYSLTDVCGYGYSGMRGNGVGKPSSLRYIGFPENL